MRKPLTIFLLCLLPVVGNSCVGWRPPWSPPVSGFTNEDVARSMSYPDGSAAADTAVTRDCTLVPGSCPNNSDGGSVNPSLDAAFFADGFAPRDGSESSDGSGGVTDTDASNPEDARSSTDAGVDPDVSDASSDASVPADGETPDAQPPDAVVDGNQNQDVSDASVGEASSTTGDVSDLGDGAEGGASAVDGGGD